MDIKNEAMKLHREHQGKWSTRSLVTISNGEELALAYTPGVAEPCLAIAEEEKEAFALTMKGRTVAVVTDGTAVLGLGDIGPQGALPVMEGKAVLFKAFGGVDAVPICLGTKDPQEIVQTVERLAPTFGGINLEDISAPRCFEIEEALKKSLDIPVFHDDQHGTAVVVLAALMNAQRLQGWKPEDLQVVVSGSGAAGIAIGKLLMSWGVRDIIMTARKGILSWEDAYLGEYRRDFMKATNPRGITGGLSEAVRGANVFIGVSGPEILTKEMAETMEEGAIILAMANPVPEIWPEDAILAGASVVGTGRSDFPNQVNNVLAFPGIFKGALQVRATDITEGMKLAAARAIAEAVPDVDLRSDYILPSAFHKSLADVVAEKVAEAARKDGVAR